MGNYGRYNILAGARAVVGVGIGVGVGVAVHIPRQSPRRNGDMREVVVAHVGVDVLATFLFWSGKRTIRRNVPTKSPTVKGGLRRGKL